MTEKQNKLNKELMKESVIRKNNDSMLAIRYGEQFIDNKKAYSINKHVSIFHTLEHELISSRYTIIIESDVHACVWFRSDGFRLDIEKNNIKKFVCTLSHSHTDKTYTFPPMSSIYTVIDKIKHITRMWDYEMFYEIAQ